MHKLIKYIDKLDIIFSMKDSILIFLQDLKNSFKDLLPIILVVGFFQLFIIQRVPDNLISIAIGLFIVAIGLALFIRGLELGVFPIGESLAVDFAKKGSIFWIFVACFYNRLLYYNS